MNAALEVKIPPCARRVVDCSKCSDVVCSIKYGARERNRPAWRSLALLCCRCCRLTTARSQARNSFDHRLIDVTPKDILAANFNLPKDVFDAFPKGETYIQAGPIVPISQALDAPWPKESTHKFRLLRDQKAVRDFEGGTF